MSKRKSRRARRHRATPPQTQRPASAPQAPATRVDIAPAGARVGDDQPPAGHLKVVATLREDVHHGSGVGGAGVDAFVARDRHARPVIWASHIEGLLRTAARQALPADEVNRLFGASGGQQQAFAMSSLYTLENPQTRVWRSSARESFDNRAPRDDTLRAIEYIPKGTRFEGLLEHHPDDADVLRRLLTGLDSIGAGRASSGGNVEFSVSTAPLTGTGVSGHGPRLRLLLTNIDPICVASTSNPGNVVPTDSYIPGRALLGALAAWLHGSGRSAMASRLVTGGGYSVSDALPIPVAAEPLATAEVCPAPLTLVTEKSIASPSGKPWWVDTAEPNPVDRRLADSAGRRFKRPDPHLFVFRAKPTDPWQSYTPGQRVRLRNGRPDPDQADPSLFATEQVVEKTCFLAEISAVDNSTMDTLCDALGPVLRGQRWLRVGRGGSPVQLTRAERVDTSPPPPPRKAKPYLILTSDLLIRDELLRWIDSLDALAVQQVPGWPAKASIEVVAQESTPVYGFNGTSRLWRRPAVAVRRGSVFTVTAGAGDLLKAIAERRWLGERTHEGFGRFGLYDALPGVNPLHGALHPEWLGHAPDDPAEGVAAVTFTWFEQHSGLAGGHRDAPSLSQWYQLAAEIRRDEPAAISQRRNPPTAGKSAWDNPHARAVLDLIEQQDRSARPEYAAMFVRWLRAQMREGVQ